jgi:hypothetical protein
MATINPECSICGETFKDGRGLAGHIQWKHSDLPKEEQEKLKKEGMSKGEKKRILSEDEMNSNSNRSIRDRELELKGMLYEIEQKRDEVEALFGEEAWSEEEQETLDELNEREQRIHEKLKEIGGDSE